MSKPRYDMTDLAEITHILRSPGGCPWDQAQTHQSIRRNFLEEAYEACEALDNDDLELMKEELGDVLLQVVFHADIEKDRGRFDFDDVCDRVCKKLIFRHPHVFGGDTTKSWEDCKALEKGQTTVGEKLDAVARSLPALWRAEKLVNKAQKNGAAVNEALPEAVEGLQTAPRIWGSCSSPAPSGRPSRRLTRRLRSTAPAKPSSRRSRPPHRTAPTGNKFRTPGNTAP